MNIFVGVISALLLSFIIFLTGAMWYMSSEKVITLSDSDLTIITKPDFCGNDDCKRIIGYHNEEHNLR